MEELRQEIQQVRDEMNHTIEAHPGASQPTASDGTGS